MCNLAVTHVRQLPSCSKYQNYSEGSLGDEQHSVRGALHRAWRIYHAMLKAYVLGFGGVDRTRRDR